MSKLSKEDVRLLKRLRFKYKIINFIWGFVFDIEYKLHKSKENIRSQRILIRDKYK